MRGNIGPERVITQGREMSKEKDTSQAGKTVLLIDDDTVLLEVMEAVLKSLGCTVYAAAGGKDAVDLLQKNMETIECFLIDLTMPEMDGWQTLAALREIKPQIPAILCSGYDENKAMDGDHAVQAQGFLHKPYSRNDLKDILDRVFETTVHKG
jgi:CheY-like chemotaxis protein